MKSKLTKYAVAAIVLIAVSIGLFNQKGLFDGTTIALADIKEAMRNVPWMHIVIQGTEYDLEGTEEIWFGFDAEISYWKYINGSVAMWDYVNRKRYHYDPKTQTIKITRMSYERKFPMSTPLDLMETITEGNELNEEDYQFIVEHGEFEGRAVQIQKLIVDTDRNFDILDGEITIIVDLESKLPLKWSSKLWMQDHVIVKQGEGLFYYPDEGPRDIYDLGVPRDSKIDDQYTNTIEKQN